CAQHTSFCRDYLAVVCRSSGSTRVSPMYLIFRSTLQFSPLRDGSLCDQGALTLAAFAAPRNPQKGKLPLK
ncbi:MAG: hypothetical protein Q8P49_04255, partial [Candidatus Liptonbacteria bacterium]|nr:hypothetical protein [Candidatus Liptonbacteria bacterium]